MPGFRVTVRRGLLALVVGVLAVGTVRAQASGGLRVRVIDSADKSAIPGASVTLSNSSHLVATTTIATDAQGFALFPVLRVGDGYVVAVLMDGYAGIRQDTRISGGATRDLVIALAPEHVERVTVVDERAQVELDRNQASTKFSSDFIQDLPIAGRSYQNVLALAPGVQDPDGDGNPNVNGARDRDFKTTVGGIANVDPLTGQVLNLVNSDSIEDLTVVTAGAGAEFGRAQGGFAQIVQKQGSNEFEGVFGLLYSSSILDGSGSTGIPNTYLPDFYNYQPMLQVSGPIVRDKLWYRLSEEYVYREEPLVLATGGTVTTQGTRQFSSDNQLTWQVSSRNKLAFNFRADPRTMTNVGVSSLVPVESSETYRFGGPTYALTWTAPYSPSLLVDSTVAYQDTHLDITPTAVGVPNDCHVPDYLRSSQCFDSRDATYSGSSPRTWTDSRERLTVKSDATYFRGRMGGANHQFKFGLIVENERYFRDLTRTPTFIEYSNYNVFSHVTEYNYAVTASLEPASRQTSTGTTWGLYGEDVIRPIANLSLTVGLRIEKEQISAQGFAPFDPRAESEAYLAATRGLSDAQSAVYLQRAFVGYEDIAGAITSVQAQFPLADIVAGAYTTQLSTWQQFRRQEDVNIVNTNLAPRLAVSWDPGNDGNTKLSASWGRYYDKIFLAVPAAEAEPVLVTFKTTPSTRVAFEPTFSYTTIDRNLKTPYQDEWSVAFERAIWQESTISLRYVHRSFEQQLQDIDINQVTGDYGACRIPIRGGEPAIVASPGTGTLVDPYTGDPYEDTDPGDGDGRIDDCVGRREAVALGPNVPTYPRADGIPDLYILNPGWGNVYQLGNYNTSRYDGITLEFVRRQYKNWQMEASYTWSKATGNGEDYSLLLGNDRASLANEEGYQSYDVRHAFKASATTIVPGGVRLGGTARWQSGLPYSLLFRQTAEASAVPYYPVGHAFYSDRTVYTTGVRNDQRNSSAWNFDAKLVKEFNLPKGMDLQLTAEIFNVFGENTYIVYNNFTKSGQQVNGTNDAYRRFGRQYQVGMRLAF